MSSNPTVLPGHRGAASGDDYGSIQQPLNQYGDKITLDATEHSKGHSSQTNSTAYDDVSQSGGNQFRVPSDRQPELCGQYNETHYPLYEDWNKQLVYDLEEKNSNNAWIYFFQKKSYSFRSWLYQFTEETLQELPPQPPVELRPPQEAIRKFTSVLISQHVPVETNRNVAKSTNEHETTSIETEWYMELRHFFVDLPTQLSELEEFLTGTSSTSSTNDNEENKADTRALANWTSYQLPDAFAGRYSVDIYPHPRHRNLRYARRIVFSQRLDISDNHDQSGHNSKWLAGRWLAVAYLFAPTRKAVMKMDVKSLLLSACTPGRHGTYRNTKTMSCLNAYNPIRDLHMRSMWPGTGKWWLLPREDLFFQLQRRGSRGSDDEMLATAFISPNLNDRSHRPYTRTHRRIDQDSSMSTTTPDDRHHMERRLDDMERQLDDMERRLHDMHEEWARPFPLPFTARVHENGPRVGGGTGIFEELNDRCQLVDRMWPALMTGQDMKEQVLEPEEGVKTAGTTAWDASSTTSSGISSTCYTPSASSCTSSQNGTGTTDDDNNGDGDVDGDDGDNDSFGIIFSMIIALVAVAGACNEIGSAPWN